jgi:hypothetical protein
MTLPVPFVFSFRLLLPFLIIEGQLANLMKGGPACDPAK